MDLFRKWYWRAAAAVLVGWIALVIYTLVRSFISGGIAWLEILVMILFSLALAIVSLVPGVGVYHQLTCKHAGLVFDRETRCRRCGNVLKGISEPRCSACGEGI